MHNLKPKKYWGQHFLKDLDIARRIVGLLPQNPEESVIEIGPGAGVLTQFLLPQYPLLRLIEVDPEAVQYLKHTFHDYELQLTLVDILKWDWDAIRPGPISLIGNLPYNISSPILFKILEHRSLVNTGVFMLQKEVAERICASPGNKSYGILSVLLGAYFELSYEFSVPPHVFRPPPKVHSGVIKMSRKPQDPTVPFSDFKRLVKAAFNMRRKMLRNALKSFDFEHPAQFQHLMTQRAEQLSIEQFISLTDALRS